MLVKSTQIIANYKESNKITKKLTAQMIVTTQSLENFITLEATTRHRATKLTCLVDTFWAQLLSIKSNS